MRQSGQRSPGKVRRGEATGAASARTAPAQWAISAAAAMSVMLQVGLAGVSIQTSLVAPGFVAAAMASVRSASTKSTFRPQWVAKLASQLRKDQYITLGATT